MEFHRIGPHSSDVILAQHSPIPFYVSAIPFYMINIFMFIAAGEGTIEKNIMMSTLAANAGPGNMQTTRIVVRNRLLILNRLPADLRFWLEVRK